MSAYNFVSIFLDELEEALDAGSFFGVGSQVENLCHSAVLPYLDSHFFVG